jgi:hypothetical protein
MYTWDLGKRAELQTNAAEKILEYFSSDTTVKEKLYSLSHAEGLFFLPDT